MVYLVECLISKLYHLIKDNHFAITFAENCKSLQHKQLERNNHQNAKMHGEVEIALEGSLGGGLLYIYIFIDIYISIPLSLYPTSIYTPFPPIPPHLPLYLTGDYCIFCIFSP